MSAQQNTESAIAREIVNTRLIDAPRERVFEAFSDPKRLANWWGPQGFTNTFGEFDFRPGGHWRFTMHGPDGADYPNHSVFDEIVGPERIVFRHLDPEHEFQMTILLVECDGKTEITWRMLHPTVEKCERVRPFVTTANEQNFDKLEAEGRRKWAQPLAANFHRNLTTMTMLKFILIGLAAIIVLFLVVASFRSDDFRVSRTAIISAPASVVYEQINDLHKWNAWSPWARMDPNAKSTFAGPPAGVGSNMAWAGNNQVGEGKMTITESKPGELVQMRLEFIKPFAATNTAEFVLKPEGDQTTVTWSMYGKNNFMSKCMGLVMNCDKMVGDQFEQGFANLKSIVTPVPAS